MKVEITYRRRPRIEMLALIDIVFLVLIVFIYAMYSMAVHRGLPVILPQSSVAEIEREKILAVTARADGSIFVDREQVSLDELTKALSEKPNREKDNGVLIFADETLNYRVLFQILDRVRQAGISRISLQAELHTEP